MPYFKPNIDAEGIHIPTYAERMEGLLSSYRSIFGEDVYTGEDSQDYQMMSVFARSLDDMTSVVVDSYNARNPNYATGNSLDILAQLIGISRSRATYSAVYLTLTGSAGVVIAAGSRGIDSENGYLWALEESVTLDENGEATNCRAICETAGAITVSTSASWDIYIPQIGWDTVTAEGEATGGKDPETDADLRVRFRQMFSRKSYAMRDTMMQALLALPGIKKAIVRENNTSVTDEVGVPGHSIAVVVYGSATNKDVANLIFRKKAPGIGTYGSTSVAMTDDYNNPYTTYFSRATAVTTSISIRITARDDFDEDEVKSLIANAVSEFINNLGIGESLIVSQLWGIAYLAAQSLASTFYITQIAAYPSGGSNWVTTVIDSEWNARFYTPVSSVSFIVTEPNAG